MGYANRVEDHEGAQDLWVAFDYATAHVEATAPGLSREAKDRLIVARAYAEHGRVAAGDVMSAPIPR
jgi:hypothetical protein